ncbi:MAG: thermonuclease family protein [Kocuria sp.]|nr:thermonuclease family protein [Kocuria sp.]
MTESAYTGKNPMSISQKALQLTAITVTVLLAASCSTTENTTPPNTNQPTETTQALRGEEAKVLRVIDGNTLDASLNGERIRMRLLNVDTPETKHPNKIIECLGPEATNFLERLLPEGTLVGLEYDQERKDKHGRTLAGVYLPDERLVNAEVARQGFGVPTYTPPNQRFLPPVQEAFLEATEQGNGLLDPSVECTIPSHIETAQEQLADVPDGGISEKATSLIESLSDPATFDKKFITIITQMPEFKKDIRDIRERISNSENGLQDPSKSRFESTSPDSPTETERVPSNPTKESVPEPRENPGLTQPPSSLPDQITPPLEQLEPRPESVIPAPQQPEAPKPAPNTEAQQHAQPNVADEAPPGYFREIPGYTGPRCYAPGGKFYKPC